MVFGIFLLLIIFIFWLLFIRGYLFKLILFIGGWIGIYGFLMLKVPESHSIAFMAAGHDYSWAFVIPTGICLMCLLTSKG